MTVSVVPKKLEGSINAPSSKSYIQRALICACISRGESFISCNNFCSDVTTMEECLRQLGADITRKADGYLVKGFKKKSGTVQLDFGDNGTALRFILPLAAALGIKAELSMSESLEMRPHSALINELNLHGAECSLKEISGRLEAGRFTLPGDISSQYISGLLMAIAVTGNEGEIILSSPLESGAYVDMTVEVLSHYGIIVIKTGNRWIIPGNQTFTPRDYIAEGDWSLSAFWICAGVRVHGLNGSSLQGDRAITRLLDSDCIDASQIPDIVPPLAAYALTKDGTTVFYNAGRLRYKETNRLKTLEASLSAIGGDIRNEGDRLIINGKPSISGGIADSYNDHRIAMALAIAAINADISVIIGNADCVKKSYPDFFEKYRLLGGEANVIFVR